MSRVPARSTSVSDTVYRFDTIYSIDTRTDDFYKISAIYAVDKIYKKSATVPARSPASTKSL